ncbi:hypothetical protein [Cecembia calidifontis]|uniref:MG2 domain-containing protein n=1 Tax=Cecembia calidifontis TaxID=1187080 RepID=A0A4V2F764_9BACT|nr:hypothetical protein [Cecembia calidifontis]RZS98729.1 hypothetical protein BC751_4396 [Cecembia calidifontis]
MMRIIKLIFILLLSLNAFGQTRDGEKVFAHLSKNICLVNDQIWFSLQVSNGNEPSPSKIAYVELIDRASLPVLQLIVPLYEGKNDGVLEIPPHLESDHYLLRFYTRTSPLHDKNGSGVYNQLVTIINPKKGPVSQKPFQAKSTYKFEKARDFHIPESRLKKNSEIQMPLNFVQNTYRISVGIQNPYLPENFQGFIGQEIYQPLEGEIRVIPELYGHIVHGKNLATEIDTTETFFLSAHGRQSVLHSAKPDQEGNLFFELGPLKEYEFLIAQSLNYEKQLNFAPQSPFWNLKLIDDFVFPPLNLNEGDRKFLEMLMLAAQLKPHFYPVKRAEQLPIVTGFVADRTYLLDDYSRFENMETTLREYVPEVLVRRQNRSMVFKLLNTPLGGLFQENPLILIDAMPVFDTGELAKFDPKDIEKLEVLTREFSFNEDKFSGVLSLTSFQNDFGKFELPKNALYLNYWPILQPKKLESPHFNPKIGAANYPDFRTCLLWNPEISSSQARFFTSEITGKFEIKVSFVDETGMLQFLQSSFDIID